MALDKVAAFQAAKTMVAALGTMQSVLIGVPADLPFEVSAFLACAGDDAPPAYTSTVENRFRIRIHMGYRVKGATAAQREVAELAIAALSDALIVAHWADKDLGGAVIDSELDFSPTRAPEFEVRAAQEWRIYVVDLVCRQAHTFSVNQ